MLICTKQPNGLYVGACSLGTPRRPPEAERHQKIIRIVMSFLALPDGA